MKIGRFATAVLWGFLAIQSFSYGQVSLPHMERIFGGAIRTLDAMEVNVGVSRIFVSAESPRALFYADVDHAATNWSLKFGDWEIVPDYEAVYDHGIPSHFAVHPESGRLFVCDEQEGLLNAGLTPNTLYTSIAQSATAVLIESNYLFCVGATNSHDYVMYFGTVDVSGVLTELPGSPIACEADGYVSMSIHPSNRKLYFMNSAGPTNLFVSTNTYDAFSAATTFDVIALPNPITNWIGQMRMGIGPDGKLFVNGLTNITVHIAMSEDDGASWATTNTGAESAGTTRGLSYAFSGTASDYEVFVGMMINTNSGEMADWAQLPRPPGGWVETHVNMGDVMFDPVDASILYMTTDEGAGYSTNRGTTIYENNQGLTATQVNDVDFPTNKAMCWLSAKNGAYYTTNFVKNTDWENANFPDGMVFSIGVDLSDTNYTTVYAGSRRIWKTTTGTNWFQVHSELYQDGVSDGVPDGWIEDFEVNSNFVYAGYHGYVNEDPMGMFLESANSGSSWARVATNIDVTDIQRLFEGGTSVVYVSADTYPTNLVTWGVYRYVPGTGTWTHDFTNLALVSDLDVATNGEVLACGMNPDSYARAWQRDRTTGAWSELTTNGLPKIKWPDEYPDWLGPCMTVGYSSSGSQVLYLGLVKSVYYLTEGASSWQTTPYMQLRNGSVIHVLVWDDLLVGTESGLISQDIDSDGDGLSDDDENNTYFTRPDAADSDSDGIGDWEEIDEYATNPTNRDTDADGSIDGDELVAGTDPTNAVSVFEVMTESSAPAATNSLFVIRWSSVEGQQYAVLRSAGLTNAFNPRASNIVATPPVNSYTDSVSSATRYYYRIATE